MQEPWPHARAPCCRWVVIGPARSGSGLHIDPLATSAWNTLLGGHKRWALFPPGTPKHLVLPKGVEREAAAWFTHVYPRAAHDPDWPTARPIDIVQARSGRPPQGEALGLTLAAATADCLITECKLRLALGCGGGSLGSLQSQDVV
jgi:hypothetical protein